MVSHPDDVMPGEEYVGATVPFAVELEPADAACLRFVLSGECTLGGVYDRQCGDQLGVKSVLRESVRLEIYLEDEHFKTVPIPALIVDQERLISLLNARDHYRWEFMESGGCWGGAENLYPPKEDQQ